MPPAPAPPTRRIKRALVVCDLQADLLPSLFAGDDADADCAGGDGSGEIAVAVDPPARRAAYLDAIRLVLLASTSSSLPEDDALVIFAGARFPPRYEGLHPEHCLYGALRRLNEKVGDKHCHWFMEGHPGSDIDPDLRALAPDSVVLWRTGHIPPSELASLLTKHSITDATVVGAKASQSLQATVQLIADRCPGIDLSTVREAIADDSTKRLDAMVDHLLPLYCRVASLEEYVEATSGTEGLAKALAEGGDETKRAGKAVRYFTDCRRGGHFSIYTAHLRRRRDSALKGGTSWMAHPAQKWYEDPLRGRQYYCPLGKRVVTFCDEPSFSEIAAFLKGRDCLDDKAKLLELAKDYLPETYVTKGGRSEWDGAGPRPLEESAEEEGPWFVKETNKNGGRAIAMCVNASGCLALASDPRETYVVQRHVPNMHLTRKGRKWHLKLYGLLSCEPEEGRSASETTKEEEAFAWTLRCHDEAFVCAASEPWSAGDLSPGAQVTTERTWRFRCGREMDEIGDIDHTDVMRRCSDAVASIVERALASKGLQGRPGKKQFELFSADFMFDATMEKLYLIEFNFSPVIFDPHINQNLTTPGLRKYHSLFERHGEAAEVNDHDMIKDAVTVIFFNGGTKKSERSNDGDVGGWRFIKTFRS